METGVEIVYGYPIDPSPEKHGEIVFGGCLVFGDDHPDRQCLNCKHRWKLIPLTKQDTNFVK
jgi:hypothetical protein